MDFPIGRLHCAIDGAIVQPLIDILRSIFLYLCQHQCELLDGKTDKVFKDMHTVK